MRPKDFWRLSPEEFWTLVQAKQPAPSGTSMTREQIAEIYFETYGDDED